jgi:hypothetical protein
MTDKTDMAYWFPLIEKWRLPVPKTLIIKDVNIEFSKLLDGNLPENWDSFIRVLTKAMRVIGFPCFLRTGHGSNKHDWIDSCYVLIDDSVVIESHVANLVEWSYTVDFMGLPLNTWAVREIIPTIPLFYAFKRFPVTREFRFFINNKNSYNKNHFYIEHVQPYWPHGAIRNPSSTQWEVILEDASEITAGEYEILAHLAQTAGRAVGEGYWSIDFLQDSSGLWWLTDIAEGDKSFKWGESVHSKEN